MIPIKITKKTGIIALCAVIAVAVLTIVAVLIFSKEKYDPEKYNSTTLSYSGGKTAENANLSAISYLYTGPMDMEIKFTVQSENSVVPEYTVDFLSAPSRMRVTVSGVTSWDYIVDGVPDDETGFIHGFFRQSLVEENGDTVLYFNLACDVKFKVAENADGFSVILQLTKEINNKNGAYIVADMYYEYQTGAMPDDTFTPTLSSDGVSVITVSEMYPSVAEAEKAKEKLVAGAYEGKELRIAEGDRFSLIPYWYTSDSLAQLNESVLSVDGAKTTLTPFFTDARFLCLLPDNRGGLFAKTEDGTEKLYIADRDGVRHALTDRTFSTVVKATVSDDGKVIAFVEHADETDLLTVLFTESGEIKVVGSTDGNDNISAIELNGDGTLLYCLKGNETYTLSEFGISDGSERILAENMIAETELFYKSGYLYYCDVVEEYEAVVRNEVVNNTQEVIAKGAQFAVSADGNIVAVVEENYDTAVRDLKIINISEKTVETVYRDVMLSEFFISSDNAYLYYVTETGDPEFYYQIMKYGIEDKETTSLAQSVNASFFASDRAKEIIISLTYTDGEEVKPVTYIADFDKINETVKNEQTE